MTLNPVTFLTSLAGCWFCCSLAHANTPYIWTVPNTGGRRFINMTWSASGPHAPSIIAHDAFDGLVRINPFDGTLTHINMQNVPYRHPGPFAVDRHGVIFVVGEAGLHTNRVVRITPDGAVTVIAGTGERGFNGDHHADALDAQIDKIPPYGIATGRDGQIYICDGSRIRMLTAQPANPNRFSITTIVSDANKPWRIGEGKDGSIYFTDTPQAPRSETRIHRRVPHFDATGVRRWEPAALEGNGARQFHGSGPGYVEQWTPNPDGSTRRDVIAGNLDTKLPPRDGVPALQQHITHPMDLAMTPNDRLLVATAQGGIRVISDDTDQVLAETVNRGASAARDGNSAEVEACLRRLESLTFIPTKQEQLEWFRASIPREVQVLPLDVRTVIENFQVVSQATGDKEDPSAENDRLSPLVEQAWCASMALHELKQQIKTINTSRREAESIWECLRRGCGWN